MNKISVIVLTRNSERTLRQCLDSIFMQTYPDYEVIIIDSHSTDNTHRILSRYIDRKNYKIITNDKDISVGLARKIGCEHASGEILAYIDSDVELPYPNWLENMHKPFIGAVFLPGYGLTTEEIIPKIAGVQTLAKCRPTDPEALKKIHSRFEYKYHLLDKDHYQIIGTSHLLLRKSVLNEVGGFKDVFSGEDVPLMKEIMNRGYKFVYLESQKCYHHHITSTICHIKRELRGLKNRIKTKLLR